jgi:hypothetical protein
MSAAGVSASTSTNIFCHTSHPRRKSSTPQAPVIKRDNTPHFYIPGEATAGLFPGQKDPQELAAAAKARAKTSNASFLTQNRLWNLVQSTLKKGSFYTSFFPKTRCYFQRNYRCCQRISHLHTVRILFRLLSCVIYRICIFVLCLSIGVTRVNWHIACDIEWHTIFPIDLHKSHVLPSFVFGISRIY